MDTLLWIVLGAALAIAEIFTATLFLLMFAVGALAAAGAAALGAPVGVQAIVFAVVSALTVLAARPTIQRHLRSSSDDASRSFGTTAIEGDSGLVIERVDADSGRIKIDGELWSARSYDATQVIEPGERVRVIEVKGVTAMVWRDEFAAGELPDVKE